MLHRAAILADGGTIRVADLPPEVSRVSPAALAATQASVLAGGDSEGGGAAAAGPGSEGPLRERVRRFELALIRRAIEEAGGDRRLAAQRLGIGLSSLYRKLEEARDDA